MMKNKLQIFRGLIYWIIIFIFIWFSIYHHSQIFELIHEIEQGKPGLIFLAIIFQILYFLFYALIFLYAFKVVKIKISLKEIVPVTFSSIFINVVMPSLGISGVALFADNVRPKYNYAKSIAGPIIGIFSDLISFSFFIVFSLIFLLIIGDLKFYYVILFLIFLILISLAISVLLITSKRERYLYDIFTHLSVIINKFWALLFSKPLLNKNVVDRSASNTTETIGLIINNYKLFSETILIALISHLINIFSLYIIFISLGFTPHIQDVLSGYAIGVLILIISIIPQGIGLVEGAMTLLFVSLGAPTGIAASAVLIWRGLNFWIPFLIGFLLIRQTKSFKVEETKFIEVWSVRIAAILTFFMGIINIASAVTPPLIQRYNKILSFIPANIVHGGHLTTVLAGFALLYLSINLWNRKRVAWAITLFVLAFSGIGHLIAGFNYAESAMSFILLSLLIIWSPHFHARSDPPSIKNGLKIFAGSIIFTLVYGSLGFYFLDREFLVHYNVIAAVKQTIIMFLQLYNPGIEPVTGFGRYFADSIYMVGIITMGYSLINLLKPLFVYPLPSSDDFIKARNVVMEKGKNSLARYAIFPDKLLFFTGESFISYVIKGQIALVLGDPIGADNEQKRTIKKFEKYCKNKHLTPAFYQTPSDRVYKNLNYKSLLIGSEAILKLDDWDTTGSKGKEFRYILNKFEKQNYKFEMLIPPIGQDTIDQLKIISDEWLTEMHGKEKRFSLGWFDRDYLSESKIAVAKENNQIIAFANLVPEYNLKILTVDLMRKNNTSPPGTMDFIFTNILLWGKNNNYEYFNFGLSPLRGAGSNPSDSYIEKFLGIFYKHFNIFYNFKGLEKFKSKYAPDWYPRYLIYKRNIDLPRIATAIIRADSGDNFIIEYLKDFIKY